MSDGFGFERLAAACAAARARVAGTAAASAVTLGGALILVLSLLPVSAREGRGSLVPLVLALVLWAGLAGFVWIARRLWRALHPHAVAEEADAAAGLGPAMCDPRSSWKGRRRRRAPDWPRSTARAYPRRWGTPHRAGSCRSPARDGSGAFAVRVPPWRSCCSRSPSPRCCGRSLRSPPPRRWARRGAPPFRHRSRRSA